MVVVGFGERILINGRKKVVVFEGRKRRGFVFVRLGERRGFLVFPEERKKVVVVFQGRKKMFVDSWDSQNSADNESK